MENRLYKRDIISIADFDRKDLELVLETAAQLKNSPRPDLLKGKVIASCFFEASTRTRLSFETAVQRLGGSLIGFSDAGNTSAKKGETLADSVNIISSYTDAFVMRHPQEGAARLASEFSSVPVINGGDGSNQHPTQTLLDLFSIRECQGKLDGLKVAFVGDLKYGRTVHSLTQALCHFGAEFTFIAPKALTMPDYILEELDAKGIKYSFSDSIEETTPQVDIIYMTRVQKERFDETEYKHIASKYILDVDSLKNAKDNLKVLHPLPRVDEIAVEVDKTPYAYYFQQAENGVYARQALLALVLNEVL
ncbi:aspartate carbamoyltransferase catalytic subunit [Endozoicomonas montiporae]|uniref:Aspartate carbamoyltransferase n=2 Tax=Endozoicomonas montiporae TaxID=1027273 RepID=A0A081N2Q2_9GAMM|nr:aspartate carbamoyltransferase [Endozoicomonas montiporae]AMO57985.1 aspartate carbamoyltransferase catalytic subunit [Endozoicomonas montiporae CL-33]KEQ12725.1 aspartate carbamoyltransferase catalytic subunit [Endozoicomonas montiporae]